MTPGLDLRDFLALADIARAAQEFDGIVDWFVFDGGDRGRQLSVRQSRNWPEGTERVWCWTLWELSSSDGVSSWVEVDSSSEPDFASMVAKVREFLGKTT
jgi:hypothetical protein